MAALLITTLFTKEFTLTLIFGVPFAVVVALLHFLMRKRMIPAENADDEESAESAPANESHSVNDPV